MNIRKYKPLLFVLLFLGVVSIVGLYIGTHDIAILNPKGALAEKQYKLIVFTALLSLIVIVPVYAMTFFIAWKYRASNTKAKYSPDWDHSKLAETIWWAVPIALISVLAVVTWITSHTLDPFRPLASSTKPMTIQVVAMEWKWLFIYPEQNIATLNYVQFPKDTPITFEVTADAPMNSLWIPQLGSQIYAMSGMKTKLHVMANEEGSYRGASANLSGSGFAGMNFVVQSTSPENFEEWLRQVRQTTSPLDLETYKELAKPSKYNPPAYYSSAQKNLYDTVVMKYMSPGSELAKDGSTTDTHDVINHTH